MYDLLHLAAFIPARPRLSLTDQSSTAAPARGARHSPRSLQAGTPVHPHRSERRRALPLGTTRSDKSPPSCTRTVELSVRARPPANPAEATSPPQMSDDGARLHPTSSNQGAGPLTALAHPSPHARNPRARAARCPLRGGRGRYRQPAPPRPRIEGAPSTCPVDLRTQFTALAGSTSPNCAERSMPGREVAGSSTSPLFSGQSVDSSRPNGSEFYCRTCTRSKARPRSP